MASKEEWCADKLSKLLNEDLRISTLTEIKDHLKEISNSEATETAEILQLPLVFDCLNHSNIEQVDLACEVLSLCLERLDIAEATNRYSIPLERALTHPHKEVKLMALEEIARIVTCEPTNKVLLIKTISKQPIFLNVIKCVGDSELGVASKAAMIITEFAQIVSDSLLAPQSLTVIKEVMSINEIVRLRFYEVFIDISVFSWSSHNKIISAGLLSSLRQEINTNDLLLRLNVIEVISKLADTDYGYDFLKEQEIIENIFKILIDKTDSMFSRLIEPGIIKFFGHVANCKPNEAFNKYQLVVNRIFDNIDDSDMAVFKASLETLSFISMKHKNILDELIGEKMLASLNLLAERLENMPTKIKILVLSFLEELLKFPIDENASRISQKWFQAFGNQPMTLVMHYVSNPFAELRSGGLGVLHSLTLHSWGHETMKNYPGLVEYLLNRTTETSKCMRDQKYDIVVSICHKEFNIFNEATMSSFEKFVNQGPHFVERIVNIAIEGDD